MGCAGGHADERTGDALQPPTLRSQGRTGGPAMTDTLTPADVAARSPDRAPAERHGHETVPPQGPALALPTPPLLLEPRHWPAALAVLFVFFAPYQTLVQTVLTDDAVRKGVEA